MRANIIQGVKMRKEQEIFDELSALCGSPGYAHAIAAFCIRDNTVSFTSELTTKNLAHLRSKSRLIGTEISTLVGLLVRQPISYILPIPEIVQSYMDQTERLLEEFHQSMIAECFKGLKEAIQDVNFLSRGEVLREPIFYGGDSAYSFQYRGLAEPKYKLDDEWLMANKGFTIKIASEVVRNIGYLQCKKQFEAFRSLSSMPIKEQTVLSGFLFTTQEIVDISGIEFLYVEHVLKAFSLSYNERNLDFTTVHDFNITNATPIMVYNDKKFLLFQYYSLTEALYEAPFYWMNSDSLYKNKALKHRGFFAEKFARERLERVFGHANVHANVNIVRKKNETIGEIDALVLFGHQAIVLQAKSKRLNLESRRGNDLKIKEDFKKAIQCNYDQAFKCASALLDPSSIIIDAQGRKINVTTPIKKLYLVCVVSDHYPALNFQARQFLKHQKLNKITLPMVTDVFALDSITEMLDTPLKFLNYLNLRTRFDAKLIAPHENTLLSHHLKYNIKVGNEYEMVYFEDDIASELNVAMSVRREGLPGPQTPEGILTRFKNTTIDRLITQIELQPEPTTIDLGMLILQLNEQTISAINNAINVVMSQSRSDNCCHDANLWFESHSAGITIHCASILDDSALPRLRTHCEIRKYTEKSTNWFGLLISPESGSMRSCLKLDFPWKRDKTMDDRMHYLAPSLPYKMQEVQRNGKIKPGRNEICPCGSGRKYKKCCLL